MKLPDKIQQALIDTTISAGHARAILSLENEKAQLAIFENIIKERLSVRNVEQLVKEGDPKISHKKEKTDINSLDYISNANIDLVDAATNVVFDVA